MPDTEPRPSTTRCGQLEVPYAAPVTLPQEYQHLNAGYEVPEAHQLECRTREQVDCQLWKQARAARLTASNFGSVLSRKSEPSEPFLSGIFSATDKQIYSAPLEYGRNNESKAKEKYLLSHPSQHLHECGLVVNSEFSFLGATPDGKICSNGESGIMEIKCPITARYMDLEKACSLKKFCLQKTVSGLRLKQSHGYYAQVQGQLMITGASYCIFVVYTKCDMHVEKILPDKCFMDKMLVKLCSFFEKYAVPFLKKKGILVCSG